MRRALILALAAVALPAASLPARAWADEPLFGYTNATDLLPKGKSQVEQWLTAREGQSNGRYSRIEGRTEVEYGAKDNLQLTLYLNWSHTSADANGVTGRTEGPGVPRAHAPSRPFSRLRVDGVTGEAIWRLASPYLSPVGLAVLTEATVGEDERALRVRGIVQKNFHDDTVVLAANAWAEIERRPAGAPALSSARPKVTTLEFDLGASYRFRPNWSAALEVRQRSEFTGFGLGGRQSSAWFVGPSVHYAAQRWFLTLTALRQIHGSAGTPALRTQVVDGLIYGPKHTRWDGIRLRVGRTF